MPDSPLSLGQFTRDLWGSFDPLAIAQLAPLARLGYKPKYYKAPDVANSVFAANSYLDFGLEITPGSWIWGFCLPADPVTLQPAQFNLQITDNSRKHKFWDEPVPSFFIGNYQATMLDVAKAQISCFPNLLNAPYPVEGEGLFSVEIWETSGFQQRIEVVLACLEAPK
jgi:hypothetical protein